MLPSPLASPSCCQVAADSEQHMPEPFSKQNERSWEQKATEGEIPFQQRSVQKTDAYRAGEQARPSKLSQN